MTRVGSQCHNNKKYYNQHRPNADVSHSTAVSSDMLEPSYWHFQKQISKAVMIKHLRSFK
jgi:hypothetical protein